MAQAAVNTSPEAVEAPTTAIQPEIGEPILICKHFGPMRRTMHFFHEYPPLRVSGKYGKEKVRFIALCDDCCARWQHDPCTATHSIVEWAGKEPIRQLNPPARRIEESD